jgi:hypothetical protein
MPRTKTKLQPANWQVTATTVHCEFIGDFVTIIVNKDWSTKCVWHNRYKQKALADKKYKVDKKIRLKIDRCQGPDCSYTTVYRDKLVKEEFGEK